MYDPPHLAGVKKVRSRDSCHCEMGYNGRKTTKLVGPAIQMDGRNNRGAVEKTAHTCLHMLRL
jgi:hypothetical protein